MNGEEIIIANAGEPVAILSPIHKTPAASQPSNENGVLSLELRNFRLEGRLDIGWGASGTDPMGAAGAGAATARRREKATPANAPKGAAFAPLCEAKWAYIFWLYVRNAFWGPIFRG